MSSSTIERAPRAAAVPEHSSSLAIEATGLVKTFGTTRAVDGVDLAVPAGVGVRRPRSQRRGQDDDDPHARDAHPSRRGQRAGARPRRRRAGRRGPQPRQPDRQLASVDEDLTGAENLVLLARLLGFRGKAARARADELLTAFDLVDAAGKQVKHYSGGMRRRLDIAASLVVTPELLILDEPTTGLDPRSRNQVWDIVRALVGQGTTVLLCTQYLDEADQLADRIAVIDRGRVIAEGTPARLKASVGQGALHVRLLDPAQRPEAERLLADALDTRVQLENDPARLSVTVSGAERASDAIAELSRSGVALADFSLGQPSLDEVFLALTGHAAESDDEIAQEDAA
jgi:ABC-2 type transport system ATP-binding protein